MFALLRPDSAAGESRRVRELVQKLGATAQSLQMGTRQVVAWTGGDANRIAEAIAELDSVEQVTGFDSSLPLVEGSLRGDRSAVRVGDVTIGGRELIVIAGPCAVEESARTEEIAHAVGAAGAKMLRGGAFKPRTLPYSFQGLGRRGLEILAETRAVCGLPIVTEALDVETVSEVAEFADMIQVGARNMQNFGLLKKLGQCGRPVLLKRGMAATVDEWLGAAEYLLAGGNPDVVLCERGIRTFTSHARNTLDLGVIDAVRERTHLPVIVDPSHAAGERNRVPALARAAIAAGADGLIVEVHSDPGRALSDGPQALRPQEFAKLMAELRQIAPIVGRTLTAARDGAPETQATGVAT